MDINKAIEITTKCTRVKMAEISWKASRYEKYPDKWPEYRATYLRYKEMKEAVEMMESIEAQKRLF